jgi:pimeloyl-ACP methyl ester carboxylesterase
MSTIFGRLVFFVFIFLLGITIFLIYRLLAPRHTPKINGDNAIAELFPIPINGVNQWLLIRGADTTKPILLFLHGGPGSAQIAIMRNFQKDLERYFIVVQWDQRGAGLSGLVPVEEATFNKEQFIADGLEVTNYLRNRFNKEKIFLVGHSWGSGLGYIMAVRHPEYFHAFAGLGQMSRDGEKLAYAETLKTAEKNNHQIAINELIELGAPPYLRLPNIKGTLHQANPGNIALSGMLIRYKWSEALGGDAKYINIRNLIVKELIFSSEYKLTDAFAWIKQKARSINLTYEECNQDLDLFSEGLVFKIPVYFLLGKWDLLTVPSGAVALMEAIEAPQKELFWFDAAHEIHWENPAEYQKVIIKCFLDIED